MEDIIDIIVTETTNTIEITAQPNDEIIDVNIIDNREDVTLNVTPTVVEININSLTSNFGVEWGDITGTLADQTDLQNVLNLKADLVDGKVPSSQLPSYVDDVVEVANYAALPVTGEVGKIYITLDTNFIYRWTGSTYVEIKDSSAVWGAITGTLSNQTDLQSALDAKLNVTTAASTYVPYTGASTNVDLGANDLTSRYLTANGASALGGVLNLKQDAAYLPKGNGFSSIASSFTAFDFYGYTGASTYKNFSLRFDGLTDNTLRTLTIPNASGTIALTSDLSAYVPYTGATANVNLGNNDVTAGSFTGGTGSFATSGAGNAVAINHSSGSGIALNITKSGSGEGIYVNKSSGSGNAVTIVGTLNATTLVKSGGTSSQFLKADGSVDSSVYALDSAVVKLTGAQTIAGVKTFTSSLVSAGATFTSVVMISTPFGAEFILNRTNNTNSGNILFATDSIYSWIAGLRGVGDENFYIHNYTNSTNSVIINNSTNAVTLTGALSGTSATFSGQVNAASKYTWGSATNGTTGQIATDGTNNYFDYIGSLIFRGAAASNTLVTFTNAGAATFSSSVTTQSHVFLNNGALNFGGTGSASSTDPAIYRVGGGVNDLAVAIGGSERMRITSSGNVGIGTTSPSWMLEVNKDTSSGSFGQYPAVSVNNPNASGFTAYYFFSGITNKGGIEYSNSANAMIFANGAERMRITSDGVALIGRTSSFGSAYRLQVQGSADTGIFIGSSASAYTSVLYMNSAGAGAASIFTPNILYVTANTNGVYLPTNGIAWMANSDERMKTDLMPIENATEKISKLRSVIGRYKTDEIKRPFLIAQDLLEVLPEAVSLNEKNNMYGVSYTEVIPLLVAGIKELKAELDTLKNK